jgi:hypothetical protein
MSFFRISGSEMLELINGQQNKNTLQKTIRDVALVTKLLKLKTETRELHKIEPTELDPLLANFVLTVRKKDGGEYEPNSLSSIISRVDRKLKKMKYVLPFWAMVQRTPMYLILLVMPYLPNRKY